MNTHIKIPSFAAGDKPLVREIHPEIRIVSEADGIVDYVASDETLDHYQEVIRVAGWRFTHFAKNAPFIDSHQSHSISCVLGKVVESRVEKNQLVQRVQWAKDIPGTLAEWGWKMTVAGFLKAVSVGFYPTRYATKYDADKTTWLQQLKELGQHEEGGIRCVYIEQEQIELSACVIGANPNALAKAYKAGALSEEDLAGIDKFCARQIAGVNTDSGADSRGAAPASPNRRARLALLMELQKTIRSV
jgi:hypothetical protein